MINTDLGLEALASEMARAAGKESLAACGICTGIAAILAVIAVVQFNKALWIADIKQQKKKKRVLRTARMVAICMPFATAVIVLLTLKLYMKPFYITKEIMDTYNINFIGRTETERDSRQPEIRKLSMSFVSRKRLFDSDELNGIVTIDGVEYFAFGGVGKRSVTRMEEGFMLFWRKDSGMLEQREFSGFMSCNRELSWFQYNLREGERGESDEAFVGPASTEAEARALMGD